MMESEQFREPRFTRAQEAAFQQLWIWHYQQRFPVALYPLLQDLIAGLNDDSIIQLLRIADAWETASDKLQAEGRTKYPAGGFIMEPNPYQEYSVRFRELLEVHFNSQVTKVSDILSCVKTIAFSLPPQKETDYEAVCRVYNANIDRLHKEAPSRRDPKLDYLSPQLMKQLMESVARTPFENPLPELKCQKNP